MPTTATAPHPDRPAGTGAPVAAPPVPDHAPRTATLARPDGTLAFEVAGSGPLIVLLPGLGQLRSAYRHLVPELVARGFRTVAVDLRGHGGSSVDWPAYGADAERPDLVAGLVLTGPFVRPQRTPWLLRASLREPGRFAALAAMLARDDAPIEARLGRVRAPALVLMGTADPDWSDPMAEARAVAEALGGRAEALEGVGDYPHLEVPVALAERLATFANTATAPSGRG